jgi:ABC-2 type transport system permease protein
VRARRLLAVSRKEFLHVRRDPRSLGLGIAIPVVLLLLFGYVLTLDVDRVPLAVWDRSRTPESRELVSRFEGSRYFQVALRAAGYPEVEEAIDDGRVLAALVIPEDFAGRVRSDRSSIVQLLLDASEANTATIALGYAETVVSGYSADLEVRWAQAKGLQGVRPPLDVRYRVWFNTDLESRNFIIPGLISVIMMIIAALLTSLTVAREWEQGTMEQLIATPVTAPELILGKLLPYFVIGMVDLAVAVAMGKYLFHVPMRGSFPLLFGIAAVFLVGALSLGMLFSVAARSQLPASQMAMAFTFLPAYLLSGFVFSIDSMPRVVRAVTYLVPSRYFVKVIKGIYLKGAGLGTLAVDTALLLVFGAGMVLASTRMFRKKLR